MENNEIVTPAAELFQFLYANGAFEFLVLDYEQGDSYYCTSIMGEKIRVEKKYINEIRGIAYHTLYRRNSDNLIEHKETHE
jgi:hypothetical protein